MVNVAIIFGKIECFDDGRAKVVVLGNRSMTITPSLKENIRIKGGRAFCPLAALEDHDLSLEA